MRERKNKFMKALDWVLRFDAIRKWFNINPYSVTSSMLSAYAVHISGFLENQPIPNIIIGGLFAAFLGLITANAAYDYWPKFISLFRKKSPLIIDIQDHYFKETEILNDAGIHQGTKRLFYCYIHNPTNDVIKNVKVNFVRGQEDHRLSFKSNNKYAINLSGDNNERVDIFISNQIRSDSETHIKRIDKDVYIDVPTKEPFKIKVNAEGYPPVIEEIKIIKRLKDGTEIIRKKTSIIT